MDSHREVWFTYNKDKSSLHIRTLEKPQCSSQSLSSEDFSKVFPWTIHLGENGYGFAIRLAIKPEQIHSREELPKKEFYYFFVPVRKNDLPETEEERKKQRNAIEQIVGEISESLSRKSSFTRIVCVIASPPEWMLSELKETYGIR